MDTFWSIKFIGFLWIITRINGLPLGENFRGVMPELTRLENGVVSLRSEEEFTASDMIDQTTIQIENISEVTNDNDSEMSVSITQMPVLPIPDNEMLTTNIPISSEEHGTTINSNMVDIPTTIKSESNEISGEVTTAAETDIPTTKIESSEDGTTVATTENTPTTMVTIKTDSSEIIMESTLPEIVQTTKIPMKSESSEDETTAAPATTEISMVTTSSMIDIPTTVVTIKVDSSESDKESTLPETTQTSMKTPIKSEKIDDLTTKMPIIATSNGIHKTEITTVATTIESTKFQSSSTSELIKEQTSEKTITEKPSKNSSQRIIISNLIWISILLIIFG